MKFKKIQEAAESGSSVLNSERQMISGISTQYGTDGTVPINPQAQPPQKPSTDLFPFEMGSIKNRLSDILDKTFSLRGQCEAALQNPSVKKHSSKRVSIKKVIKELDKINKILTMDVPKYLERY